MEKSFNTRRLERVDDLIAACQTITEIREALEPYGYNLEKLSEGKEVQKSALDAIENRNLAYADYHKAVENFNSLRDEANTIYKGYVQLARLIKRNTKWLMDPWSNNTDKDGSFENWVKDVQRFYDIVGTEDWVNAFSAYNVTKEKLENGGQLLKDTYSANEEKELKRRIAKGTTATRDEKLGKVDIWCSGLMTVMQIALGNNSPHLNQLRKNRKKPDASSG